MIVVTPPPGEPPKIPNFKPPPIPEAWATDPKMKEQVQTLFRWLSELGLQVSRLGAYAGQSAQSTFDNNESINETFTGLPADQEIVLSGLAYADPIPNPVNYSDTQAVFTPDVLNPAPEPTRTALSWDQVVLTPDVLSPAPEPTKFQLNSDQLIFTIEVLGG